MKGIVSAGDKRTAQAGVEILRMGGNAYDAVTACVFAACVAEPALTSPAGGGFLLASSPSAAPEFYDFFVDVPPDRAGDDKDFYPIEVDFGSTTQDFHVGSASCAVPGVTRGLLDLQAAKGALSLDAVLQPAIALAERGVVLTQFQRYVLEILSPIFMERAESRALYAPSGELLRADEALRNPDYAVFLKALATQGASLFYEGEVADRIHAACAGDRGGLHRDDLKRYEARALKPVRFHFGDLEIVTSPPPSMSGLLMQFTLGLLEGALDDLAWGSAPHLIRFIEAMRATQDFREQDFRQHISAGNHTFRDLRPGLLERYAHAYMSKTINPFGNTTHISIIDSDRNSVSCTSSNGEGCGIVIPDTGIMLNNMLGEADLNPGGFFKWPDYARLPSMMAPTMIFRRGEPYMLLGSSGSNRIRSAIVQTILNHFVFGQDLVESVRSPRIHYEDGVVYMEPGFGAQIVDEIKRQHPVVSFEAQNLFFGGVQTATFGLEGCGDLRRGGWTEAV